MPSLLRNVRTEQGEEPSGLDVRRRTLGMAIVPGEHIRSISMATNINAMATETSSTTTEASTSSLIAAEACLSHTQTAN